MSSDEGMKKLQRLGQEDDAKEELIPTPMSPLPRSIYRHAKGSNYAVLGVARIEETPNAGFLVAYRKINGAPNGTNPVTYADSNIWLRPINEFLDGRVKKIGIVEKQFRD